MFLFIILSVSTVFAILAWAIWKKTRADLFVFGLLAIYYWTFAGSWSYWAEAQNIENPLSDRFFKLSVDMNEAYFEALMLYALFMILIELTILIKAIGPLPAPVRRARIHVSHNWLIIVSVICLTVSYLLIRDNLSQVWNMDQNLYRFGRDRESVGSDVYSIYRALINISGSALAIGAAVSVSGGNSRYVVGNNTSATIIAYPLIMIAFSAFNLVLGNRGLILGSLLTGLALYSFNSTRIPRTKLMIFGCIALLLLGLIGVIRHRGPSALETISPETLYDGLMHAQSSAEQFCAHYSLYGILHNNLPISWGSSFWTLIMSAIPRFIWDDRPPTSYDIYSSYMGYSEEVGFTIHHAAGWYLNFGSLGIIAGALLIGTIWIWLYNSVIRLARESRSKWSSVLRLTGLSGFVGFIPFLLRDGPEAYRPLMVFGIFLPSLILFFSSRTIGEKNKRSFAADFNIKSSSSLSQNS